jgi:hypothetical protein
MHDTVTGGRWAPRRTGGDPGGRRKVGHCSANGHMRMLTLWVWVWVWGKGGHGGSPNTEAGESPPPRAFPSWENCIRADNPAGAIVLMGKHTCLRNGGKEDTEGAQTLRQESCFSRAFPYWENYNRGPWGILRFRAVGEAARRGWK